jgi:Phage major coat protein, Gp8
MSGTNAVNLLGDNVENATNVAWPLVIVIITGLIALSVFLKVGKRGGVRA